MARKRFTPEQIVVILREVERGGERKTLFRKHGISEQTFYRWKRMYGGLGESEVKRIKQLEEENRKLKQMVGEQAMVIEVQREVMKKKGLA
jgi:putative transposase